jgi:hypothetical protein
LLYYYSFVKKDCKYRIRNSKSKFSTKKYH